MITDEMLYEFEQACPGLDHAITLTRVPTGPGATGFCWRYHYRGMNAETVRFAFVLDFARVCQGPDGIAETVRRNHRAALERLAIDGGGRPQRAVLYAQNLATGAVVEGHGFVDAEHLVMHLHRQDSKLPAMASPGRLSVAVGDWLARRNGSPPPMEPGLVPLVVNAPEQEEGR